MKRGAIAEGQERRRQEEWEAHRMAGVVEAAAWIKGALAAEIGADADLRERLDRAVDRCCARIDKPADRRVAASLLEGIGEKRKWKRDMRAMVWQIFGVRMGDDAAKPAPSEASVRADIRENYGLETGDEARPEPGR